ncbi:hypothetical protein HPP92_016565 [Vanilla planifolia]|uniref:Uncharacterized protein n=1 Tax=Vanilla planifolia TaxID=51239 RepID=A0A835QLQ1_VANPL|nr:hypothetical protein HPP92_016565 [Vanilla planifolia]
MFGFVTCRSSVMFGCVNVWCLESIIWCFLFCKLAFFVRFITIEHIRLFLFPFLMIHEQVTENGKQERHLVTTVGKFSVIWNFLQVKNSSHECYRNQEGLKSCYCYRIVPKDESIVDSRFMHDKFSGNDSPEAPLVVATPMKVSSFSISSRR